jgi:signal transduction histidine kinase
MGTAVMRVRAEDELKRSYRKLEKMVHDRTAKLLVANTKLKSEVEERRAAEDRLLLSKTMLQAVFDGISEPLILVDKTMRVKMINQSATSYYDIPDRQEAIGLRCFENRGKSEFCKDCEIPRAVLKKQPIVFERSGFMDPNRLERIFIYPVKENGSGAGDAIIRITDITEERRIEQQLIQSEKMASLGVLVSSIAHEINNPNNLVTFNLPILRDYLDALIPIVDKYADSNPDFELFHMSYPEFRKDIINLLDNIEHGSGRISKFVFNLREFVQNNGKKSKKWADLRLVVDKVLSICEGKIKKAVKAFTIEIPDNLPAIYTDPHALEQVLINLLVNGSQAMDKKDSRLKLVVSIGNTWREHTIIEVIDNGCGMDEETRRHIFNPFFTTKAPADGTGLGLYVCQNLIQALGGLLEVESEVGLGSTFRVILPDKEHRKQPGSRGRIIN